MNKPRFTAEASLHKRSECYYQEAGNVVASSNGVLPAMRIDHRLHHWQVIKYCRQIGATYMPDTHGNTTYGCFNADTGKGVFCGGVGESENTCDKW